MAAGAVLHDGLWVPTCTTKKWVRRAAPKRANQQHTVEYIVPCTTGPAEPVPSHKIVHTFTRAIKTKPGMKCPHSPELRRVLNSRDIDPVLLHLQTRDPTWQHYEQAAAAVDAEWQCSTATAGPTSAGPQGDDRRGQRTVQLKSQQSLAVSPQRVCCGECGSTMIHLTTGVALI